MKTRDEVVALVIEILKETVEELEDKEIDASMAMTDMGVNSLDIVEIVSASMRQLKVKIPRSKLNELKSMDELIDLLHKLVVEKG